MPKNARVLPMAGFVVLIPSLVLAGKLACPDGDGLNHREVMATSAPEIKVRANLQDDSRHWGDVVKPLAQKAVKLAKAQRATLIEEGIDHGCNAPQIYVGQMIPFPNKNSGCDQRTVTRPAEGDQVWVQVIATCKYDWACCTPEENKAAVGYSLEGPLNPTPAAAPASPPAKPKS